MVLDHIRAKFDFLNQNSTKFQANFASPIASAYRNAIQATQGHHPSLLALYTSNMLIQLRPPQISSKLSSSLASPYTKPIPGKPCSHRSL